MIYTLVFMFGLAIGGFLGVCVYRIPKGLSVVFPRSRCGGCGAGLRIYHLIPVVGYLATGGKCSFCRRMISPVYPVVELLTAATFVSVFYKCGMGADFLKYAVLSSVLIVTSFIDIRHMIIPDGLIIFGLVAGWAFILADKGCGAWDGFMGMVIGGGILFLIARLSKGGMGGGDVKLAAVAGLFLGGGKMVAALFLAFVLGGVAGALLLFTGVKCRKDPIPFGPFISISAYISLVWGDSIISSYYRYIWGASVMAH